MGIFSKNNKEVVEERGVTEYTPVIGRISTSTGGGFNESKQMKISAVFRAINLIASAVANLPLIPYTYKDNWRYIDYDSTLYNLLNYAPNLNQSRYTFFYTLVANILSKGNGYVYIDRDKNNIINNLYLLNPDDIEVQSKGFELIYRQKSTNKFYDQTQIIHILNIPNAEGTYGISTLKFASLTLDTAYAEKQHMNSYFKGAALRGILKPAPDSGKLNDKQVKLNKDKWNQYATTNEVNNGIIILGEAMDFQSFSISNKDAMVLESQNFSINEIARFFSVPPALLYADGQKYNTSEQQSIDFINSTLLSWSQKIQNEFFRKLYLRSEWDLKDLEFDLSAIYKADLLSQAEYWTKCQALGIFTVNDLRAKGNINAYPVAGGNEVFVNVQTLPLKRVLNPEDKSTDKPIDNKVI